jgi:hypothetical protein
MLNEFFALPSFHKLFTILCCSYQEAIEEITKRMGAGMAKFICKEVCDAC